MNKPFHPPDASATSVALARERFNTLDLIIQSDPDNPKFASLRQEKHLLRQYLTRHEVFDLGNPNVLYQIVFGLALTLFVDGMLKGLAYISMDETAIDQLDGINEVQARRRYVADERLKLEHGLRDFKKFYWSLQRFVVMSDYDILKEMLLGRLKTMETELQYLNFIRKKMLDSL